MSNSPPMFAPPADATSRRRNRSWRLLHVITIVTAVVILPGTALAAASGSIGPAAHSAPHSALTVDLAIGHDDDGEFSRVGYAPVERG